MTDSELFLFLKNRYGKSFPHPYLKFANNFAALDKGLSELQTHHVCPRCCGGDDDPRNLIRVSFRHHRKLHQMILQATSLTSEEKSKLEFAYRKMRKA